MATDPRQPLTPTLAAIGSADYIDELYGRWREDPSSVAEEWRLFFTGFDLAMCPRDCVATDRAQSQSSVASLMFAYRSIGHLIARVDPLGMNLESHPELELDAFGLTEKELDQVFDTGHLGGPKRAPLREILAILKDTYCRSVGVEYVHIQDREVRRWLQGEMEPIRNRPSFDKTVKLEILKQLTDAEIFETFIQSRYPGQKRFSLEGAESLIPALRALLDEAADQGADEIVVGMAHRGRLNVLANVLEKPYQLIFHEFEDNLQPDSVGGDGDVKYHRGYGSRLTASSGKTLNVTLTANPSHLEAVNPVVEGRARAKQRRLDDTQARARVVPLLIHGDAAFAGQGLVAETLNLSQLPGYRTGGTVHFVINNQIGFTTTPGEARSSHYSTDVAKLVEAPILHVNGDDPEAVVHVTRLAMRFRQRFHRDVVVDMLCYRRHGHNEGDEPAFTQPLMYQRIRNRPSVRQLYQLELENSLAITLGESTKIADAFQGRLLDAFNSAKGSCTLDLLHEHAFSGLWQGLNTPHTFDPAPTGARRDALIRVASALTTVPDGFRLNPKIQRRLRQQLETIERGGEIDWPLAELLAFGSLLEEGVPVRLSGQDSTRGTFSQRHAMWYDTKTQDQYIPLNHISADQQRFCVYNSMLSEAAVLGFDYGYSLVDPHILVLWEAQFGDFANGAQVIIDQFIAASLDKWERSSGLVMLLPHGYEGQGPEHSSAYLERYLTLCAEDNIQVCNLTTPAQYFHALRRQVKRSFRRPLVVMSPKSLLRHKGCVSPVSELVDGRFFEVLDDPAPPQGTPRRLVLCTGKVYYDLIERREAEGVDDVAIVRLEQLYPFQEELFRAVTDPYRGADEVLWVQEETRNRGAWGYLLPRLLELFPEHRPRYVGREPSASPATGSARIHRAQQDKIVSDALGLERHDKGADDEG